MKLEIVSSPRGRRYFEEADRISGQSFDGRRLNRIAIERWEGEGGRVVVPQWKTDRSRLQRAHAFARTAL